MCIRDSVHAEKIIVRDGRASEADQPGVIRFVQRAAVEKGMGRGAERRGNTGEGLEIWIPAAAFDFSDMGCIQTGPVCEFFQRKSGPSATPPDVAANLSG